MEISVGILTVSDRCFLGETEDKSGPLLALLVTERLSVRILEKAVVGDRDHREEVKDERDPLFTLLVTERLSSVRIAEKAVVPDDRRLISETLQRWCDDLRLDLILTTGGTGFAARDITPEATKDIIDREVPGLVEAMRAASAKHTPHAMLSRAIAGIRGSTLVVNLPGSPKAAKENLEVILPALPHGIEILRGSPGADQRHQHPAAG